MGAKGSKKKSILSREDTNFLMAKTSFSETQIREWHKVYVRECPDGYLSRDKFIDIYSELFPDGKAKSFYQHIFRTFDEDNSGMIDFKEFLMAISTTKSGTPEERLELAFRLYDIDRNGFIEEHEMAEVMKAIYIMAGKDPARMPESPADKTKDIFQKMDENGDGVLTLDEFIKGCMNDSILYKMLIQTRAP